MTGPPARDWEAEGLLDGLDSREDRAARRELLDRLADEGCTADELRRAVAEDRLSLLPVEKPLLRDRRYTPAEASDLTGLSMDYIKRDFVAIGLTFDEEERHFTEDNIDAMRGLRAMMDAGVSERDVLMLTRMVGDASAKLAEAVMRTLGGVLLRPGDTERDFGLRVVEAANLLMPPWGPCSRARSRHTSSKSFGARRSGASNASAARSRVGVPSPCALPTWSASPAWPSTSTSTSSAS